MPWRSLGFQFVWDKVRLGHSGCPSGVFPATVKFSTTRISLKTTARSSSTLAVSPAHVFYLMLSYVLCWFSLGKESHSFSLLWHFSHIFSLFICVWFFPPKCVTAFSWRISVCSSSVDGSSKDFFSFLFFLPKRMVLSILVSVAAELCVKLALQHLREAGRGCFIGWGDMWEEGSRGMVVWLKS